MPPKRKRFKPLLDEMLPRREKYPLANNFHNLRHIVHDYKKAGISDVKILKIASKDQRILLTKNIRDFKYKGKLYGVDVIGVTENIPPGELDKTLMVKLKRWGKSKMSGRFTKITRVRRRF